MPEPIEYQILTNLRDALAEIAVSRGYHYDVRGTAVKLDPNQDVEELVGTPEQPGPRPFVLLEANPESWDYGVEHGSVRILMPIAIHWVSESEPTQDDDRMQVFFRGCADVERAVAQDPGRGRLASGGSAAIDTRIVRRTMDHQIDGSRVWATVDVIVRQLRVYGQPDA